MATGIIEKLEATLSQLATRVIQKIRKSLARIGENGTIIDTLYS